MELLDINYWTGLLHFGLTAFAALCLVYTIRLLKRTKKKR